MRINGPHSERSIVKARPQGVSFHFAELDMYRHQLNLTRRDPLKSFWLTLTNSKLMLPKDLSIVDVGSNGMDAGPVY